MIIDKNAIKRKLEQKRCAVHNETPKITVTHSGFDFSCCCEPFKDKLIKETESLIAKASEKAISDSMNKLFR